MTAKKAIFTFISALLITLSLGASTVAAQSTAKIEDRGVKLEFPDRLTFKAHIEDSSTIERVVLEYGVEKLTCGTVTAKAFPDFQPGKTSVDVSWTWEMRKSGSEPPGSTIWYRWRVTNKSGGTTLSDRKTFTWLDDTNDWQSLTRDKLTLHWYDSPRTFAQELLDSASSSLTRLAQTTGVTPQSQLHLYIYADNNDMKDAVLYEPGWTGGQAFPSNNIVIIGINPDTIDWGKRTEAHELTHLLVGFLTFSCLSDVPTWLNEGIAVYGEGGPSKESQDQLKSAVKENTLISVRALSGGFSEHPDKADLSYSQSYSLVNFLITEFGRDKLLLLFDNMKQGTTTEDSLNAAYGFGLDGLEDRWRASVGAKPRRSEGVAATVTVRPTVVPTYAPVSAAPVSASIESEPTPEDEAEEARIGTASTPGQAQPQPSGFNFLLAVGIAAAVALILIVLLVFVIARRRRA
ncbi:MAG: peptidase MA family metallohydrolase [Chloroflexia bacterium]